jgi:hypothetical protein
MQLEEIRQALLQLDALRAQQGSAFSRWLAGTAQQDQEAYEQEKRALEERLPGFEIFWMEELYRPGHVLMPMPLGGDKVGRDGYHNAPA